MVGNPAFHARLAVNWVEFGINGILKLKSAKFDHPFYNIVR